VLPFEVLARSFIAIPQSATECTFGGTYFFNLTQQEISKMGYIGLTTAANGLYYRDGMVTVLSNLAEHVTSKTCYIDKLAITIMAYQWFDQTKKKWKNKSDSFHGSEIPFLNVIWHLQNAGDTVDRHQISQMYGKYRYEKKPYNNASYSNTRIVYHKLFFFQPTRSNIQNIESLLTKFSVPTHKKAGHKQEYKNVWVSSVEFAYDYTFHDEIHVHWMKRLFDTSIHQRYAHNQKLYTIQDTSYTRRQTTSGTNTCYYSDRESKVDDSKVRGKAFHFELRLFGKSAINRIGIYRPADLLNFDLHQLFRRCVEIKYIRPKNLSYAFTKGNLKRGPKKPDIELRRKLEVYITRLRKDGIYNRNVQRIQSLMFDKFGNNVPKTGFDHFITAIPLVNNSRCVDTEVLDFLLPSNRFLSR
jgi:hypothetical protein